MSESAAPLPPEPTPLAEPIPPTERHLESAPSPETLQLRHMMQVMAVEYLLENRGWVQDQVNAPEKVDYLRVTIYKQLQERFDNQEPVMVRFVEAADARRLKSPFDLLISAIRVGAKDDGQGMATLERVEKFTEEFIT